jgi:hypothetical protein
VNPLALLGPALILAAIAIVPVRNRRPGVRIVAAVCGAAAAFVPIGPSTFAAFFLGVVGPVSAATLVITGNLIRGALLGESRRAWPSTAMLLCLLLTGLVFYPLTFGLSSFDPYELGYRGVFVPALMLAYVLVGWLARAADIPCWVGLASVLYLIGAYDSNNQWDYLIFPADPLCAAGVLALQAWSARRGSGHQAPANLENAFTTRS